jgi:hypothetical protein
MNPTHVIWNTEMKLFHAYVSSLLVSAPEQIFHTSPSPLSKLKAKANTSFA